MDAGMLNRRVVIQSRSGDTDAVGQPLDDWSEFATVWANIRFNTGLKAVENMTAGAQTSVAMASIRIRFRNDIRSDMRVVDGSTVYQIITVYPNVGAQDYTDLACEVINGGQ